MKSDKHQEGASLVEFALVAPLLIFLLIGVIEFGYLFGQFNEVRHSSLQGARYGAVSNPDRDGGGVSGTDVVDAACDAIDLPGSTLTITMNEVDSSGNIINIGGNPERGDYARVDVTATVNSLSGVPLIADFLPDQLSNEATFRLEQDAAWTAGDSGSC